MSYTRQDWARAFLAALGNHAPTQATVDWVVGWTYHETTTGQGATYNLLNTTERSPGSTLFGNNSAGVQNYTSFAQGVQVNAHVLGENFNGYAALKQALLNNDINALNGSAGVRQGLSTWCGGCGYGVGFQSVGAAHRNDQFPGSTGGTPLAQISSGGGSLSTVVGNRIITSGQTQPTTGNGGGTITPATGGSTTANQNNSGGSSDPLSGLAQVLVQFFAPFKAIGDFFATAGQWLSNPVRVVKLVVGVGLIGIAAFATLSAVSKGIANSPPGKAALGAAETMATGGASAAGKAGKAAAGAAKVAKQAAT